MTTVNKAFEEKPIVYTTLAIISALFIIGLILIIRYCCTRQEIKDTKPKRKIVEEPKAQKTRSKDGIKYGNVSQQEDNDTDINIDNNKVEQPQKIPLMSPSKDKILKTEENKDDIKEIDESKDSIEEYQENVHLKDSNIEIKVVDSNPDSAPLIASPMESASKDSSNKSNESSSKRKRKGKRKSTSEKIVLNPDVLEDALSPKIINDIPNQQAAKKSEENVIDMEQLKETKTTKSMGTVSTFDVDSQLLEEIGQYIDDDEERSDDNH